MEGHIERTIRVNGQLMDLSTPKVMGILNVTPDSFYAGSRKETTSDIVNRVEQIITEGADMIDIGAYSSRSNAEHVSTKEEMARLRKGLEAIREVAPRPSFPSIHSVQTWPPCVWKNTVQLSSMTFRADKWTNGCSTP